MDKLKLRMRRKKLSLKDLAGPNLSDDAKLVFRVALKESAKEQNRILRKARKLERLERRRAAR